jgi:hypothetical protein
MDKSQDWICEEDKIIELNLKQVFPLLWLNIQKLNLLSDNKITIVLKYRKDFIITNDKIFIVDTRSSLKRAGGKTFIFIYFNFSKIIKILLIQKTLFFLNLVILLKIKKK